MSAPLGPAEEAFVTQHRVGHLATADRLGRPRVVPVCYVLVDGAIFVALDGKPKSVDARILKRVRNIQENPEVSFLVDDYDDDWEKLAYVQIQGRADLGELPAADREVVVARLRAKYPQYRSMSLDNQPLIRIRPTSVHSWSWRGWPTLAVPD